MKNFPTLKQFRASHVQFTLAQLPEAIAHCAKLGSPDQFDGWPLEETGVTEIHVYEIDGMPVIILRQDEGVAELQVFAYAWQHPCDEYEKNLRNAEAKLLLMLRDEWS